MRKIFEWLCDQEGIILSEELYLAAEAKLQKHFLPIAIDQMNWWVGKLTDEEFEKVMKRDRFALQVMVPPPQMDSMIYALRQIL